MSRERRGGPSPGPVRCAIYTRKSTTEGLDSGFSTLDAQREACDLYVRSQAAQGWEVLPERYDDGGYTGGNLERPALGRLLEEIDRGTVGMVVVYKLDRLSRSLLDFTRLMERFEKKQVGFVSITQQFDTSSSMGRLTLNMLLSFAQFERELISERTRDKIQAARRRGRWTGGKVVLGYAVDPDRRGLKVVPEEAQVVRLAFNLYLQTRSIVEVARRLDALGSSRRTNSRAKQDWDKNAVQRLLRNPTYAGKTRSRDGSLHPGEHQSIVSPETFQRVQESLDARTTGTTRTNRNAEYLLTGILRCGPCNAAMTSSASIGRNRTEYRYYRCSGAERKGVRCPTGLLPVLEIEHAVVEQLKDVTAREELRERVLAHVAAGADRAADLGESKERLEGRLAALEAEAKRLLSAFSEAGSGGRLLAGRLGEIEGEMARLRQESADLGRQFSRLEDARVQTERVAAMLEAFDEIWGALVPEERRELLHLLIREVVVDLDHGGLRIGFHNFVATQASEGVVA